MNGDWKALAEAVRRRRRQLRLPLDLSDRNGPGEMSMRRIEQANARGLRDATKTRLERVMQWEPGLVDDILAGTAVEEQIMPQGSSRAELQQVTSVLDVHLALQEIPPLALVSFAVARLSMQAPTEGRRPAVEALTDAMRLINDA